MRVDTLNEVGDVCWLTERLAEAKAYLNAIEARDYRGESEEQKEVIAAEHTMCEMSIWVLEDMIESRQTESN